MPVTFYSSDQTVTCPDTDSGGPFESVLGKFTSLISQADADAQATAYLSALFISGCKPIPVPVVSNGHVPIYNNAPFSYQIEATNSPTSYGIGLGGLPSGLSLNTTTGLITGTVTGETVGNTIIVDINATNAGGTSVSNLTEGLLYLTVTEPAPVITSPLTANIGNSVAFTYQIVATNSPTSYGATGLPSGINIDASTGLISGTATGMTVGNVYTIPISATNVAGTGSGTLMLTVVPTLNASFTDSGDGGASTSRQVSIDGGAYATVNFSQNYIFLHQIKMRTTVTAPTPVFGTPQFQWNMDSGLISTPDSSLWSKPLQSGSIASIIGTSLGIIRCINQWGGNGGSPGLDYTFPSASSTNQTDNLSGTLSSNTSWEHLITASSVSFSSLVMETILNF
jgi:hypothetical protein